MVTSVGWRIETSGDGDQPRQRLIDAAAECVDRYGVAKTTVEDVAAAAGVSRATAYRYVKGRDELMLAVLLQEADRLIGRVRQRVARVQDLESKIASGMSYAVRAVRRNDRLLALVAPDKVGLIPIVGSQEAVWHLCYEHLLPPLREARREGRLREDLDPVDAVELVVRLGLSLLVVDGPAPRTEAAERAFTTTVTALLVRTVR